MKDGRQLGQAPPGELLFAVRPLLVVYRDISELPELLQVDTELKMEGRVVVMATQRQRKGLEIKEGKSSGVQLRITLESRRL
jgi:hypothetical protein